MEVHLHLGAHRTGSSRLQRYFSRRRAGLLSRGIAVFTPDQLRPRPEDPAPFWPPWGRTGARFRDRVEAAMAEAQAQGAFRAVLSDEELLGSINRLLARGRFYGDVGRRLGRSAPALAGHRVVVFIVLRDYAPFLSSLYAHRCKTRAMPEFSANKARYMASRRRWPQVIRDVKTFLPEAELRVMRFEDSAARGHRTLCHIVGAGDLRRVDETARPVGPSPSAEAVRVLNTMTGENTGSEADRLAVIDRFPRADWPAFDPWTPAERQKLHDAYRRDLDEILSIDRVREVDLSRPPGTRAPMRTPWDADPSGRR